MIILRWAVCNLCLCPQFTYVISACWQEVHSRFFHVSCNPKTLCPIMWQKEFLWMKCYYKRGQRLSPKPSKTTYSSKKSYMALKIQASQVTCLSFAGQIFRENRRKQVFCGKIVEFFGGRHALGAPLSLWIAKTPEASADYFVAPAPPGRNTSQWMKKNFLSSYFSCCPAVPGRLYAQPSIFAKFGHASCPSAWGIVFRKMCELGGMNVRGCRRIDGIAGKDGKGCGRLESPGRNGMPWKKAQSRPYCCEYANNLGLCRTEKQFLCRCRTIISPPP